MADIIGHGVDIIEIDRIQGAIEKWGDHFLNTVYTQDEIDYASKHKSPYQHYAARFAAKEAVYKALNDSSVGWKDIWVLNDKRGKPVCHCPKHKDKTILLTISHSHRYAVASAIITSS